MNVFLKIAKEKYKNYFEEVMYLIGKGHSITEFCLLPITDKSFKIDKYTKNELQKIVNSLDEITKMLENFNLKENN